MSIVDLSHHLRIALFNSLYKDSCNPYRTFITFYFGISLWEKGHLPWIFTAAGAACATIHSNWATAEFNSVRNVGRRWICRIVGSARARHRFAACVRCAMVSWARPFLTWIGRDKRKLLQRFVLNELVQYSISHRILNPSYFIHCL